MATAAAHFAQPPPNVGGPPPPGGAGGQPAGGGAAPAVGFTTYHAYFGDDSNDPYCHNYQALMSTFDVPLNNAGVPQPATLANQVANSSVAGAPTLFVTLARDATDPTDMGRIILMHRVTMYPATIGVPATGWENHHFAFVGDARHGSIGHVELLQNYFNQIAAIHRIPTPAQEEVLRLADPAATTLGPFANNDAGTVTICTHCVMAVPPRFYRYGKDR